MNDRIEESGSEPVDALHNIKLQENQLQENHRSDDINEKPAWSNVLLTSAGFEDMDGKQKQNIVRCFLNMLGKSVKAARILFIPTAAIYKEAREMVVKCRDELLHMGILPENIITYELDGSMPEDTAMSFDVIYFTGGDTNHLLRRIRETDFDTIVMRMVHANKVYVGVSAGSLIATPNIGKPQDPSTAGFSLINAYLSVHCPENAESRKDLPFPHIALTDNQALAVTGSGYQLVEG